MEHFTTPELVAELIARLQESNGIESTAPADVRTLVELLQQS